MREQIFRCNLCQEKAPSEALFGLAWVGTGYVFAQSPTAVETHICRRCVESIRALPQGEAPR